MSTYAWILIATIAFPLILSFDRRVRFVRDWPRALASALIVGVVFVTWDAWAAWRGDWGFAPDRSFALRIAGLPVEEWLFFLLVPLACLFISRCLDVYLPARRLAVRSWPFGLASLLCLALALLAWPRFYTATLLVFAAVFLLLLAGPWRRRVATGHFWLAQLISLVPFVVVNGLLTGIPVVVYSPDAILGVRLGTIPIEDALYSFVLVGANLLVFGSLAKKQAPVTGRRAIVIGAGLGGLAVAARLARLGWRTTVYEAADAPGGKAGNATYDGFRYDTGPSLLTLPAVFDELFAFCGDDRRKYLDFEPLDPLCAYWWPDGSRLASRTAAEMPAILAAAFGEDETRVAAYFRQAAGIHRLSADLFLEHSLHEPGNWLNLAGLKGLLGLPRMAIFTTMHRLHGRFFKDQRTRQLFDRLATYNGSSPYRTPGTLAIIAHGEYGLGGYAVRGGIQALPRAIESLGSRLGVDFRYGRRVERILVENRAARGVVVDGALIDADLVVCNADAVHCYEQLLERRRDRLFRRQLRQEASSSGLVFYWGIKASFPQLQINNIFFSADYREDFRAIFDELCCPDDPTVYLNITSKVDAADAPPGCENWFVLVNAPRDAGQDWMAETKRMRAVVTGVISRALGTDITPLIVSERVMSPPQIAERTGSVHGSLYGISSNSRTAAFLRHPNRHPDIAGLYFCGGSVHPGGGMPLVLKSARIAAELATKYAGNPQ